MFTQPGTFPTRFMHQPEYSCDRLLHQYCRVAENTPSRNSTPLLSYKPIVPPGYYRALGRGNDEFVETTPLLGIPRPLGVTSPVALCPDLKPLVYFITYAAGAISGDTLGGIQ